MSFIDVGQGDAVLVQPGGQSYLVDAGKPEEGPNVVDFLRSRGVESLNGIVVSNPDADHIGGFLDVLDTYQVATVYLSGDPKGTSTFNAFLRGVRDEGANVKEVRAGLYWHQHAPFTRNPAASHIASIVTMAQGMTKCKAKAAFLSWHTKQAKQPASMTWIGG